MPHAEALLIQFLGVGLDRALEGELVVIREELEVVDEDVGCFLEG